MQFCRSNFSCFVNCLSNYIFIFFFNTPSMESWIFGQIAIHYFFLALALHNSWLVLADCLADRWWGVWILVNKQLHADLREKSDLPYPSTLMLTETHGSRFCLDLSQQPYPKTLRTHIVLNVVRLWLFKTKLLYLWAIQLQTHTLMPSGFLLIKNMCQKHDSATCLSVLRFETPCFKTKNKLNYSQFKFWVCMSVCEKERVRNIGFNSCC